MYDFLWFRKLLIGLLFLAGDGFAGFRADTLVKSSSGTMRIQDLSSHAPIVSRNDMGDVCAQKVMYASSHHASNYIRIIVDDEVIDATVNQQFYVANAGVYKRARDLSVSDCLLTATGSLLSINAVCVVEEDEEFYELTVAESHTYFVAEHEILVHNVAPITLGLAWALGSSALEFAGTSLATCLVGIPLAIQMYKDRFFGPKNKMRLENHGVTCGGAPLDPNEFDKQHPHGKYVGSSKHHKNSFGKVSKAPKNGQKALDQSVRISGNSPKRIGVSDGEIVELRMTRLGEYHGYVVEWDYLDDVIQSLLRKNGLTNHKGKVLL